MRCQRHDCWNLSINIYAGDRRKYLKSMHHRFLLPQKYVKCLDELDQAMKFSLFILCKYLEEWKLDMTENSCRLHQVSIFGLTLQSCGPLLIPLHFSHLHRHMKFINCCISCENFPQNPADKISYYFPTVAVVLQKSKLRKWKSLACTLPPMQTWYSVQGSWRSLGIWHNLACIIALVFSGSTLSPTFEVAQFDVFLQFIA